MPPMQWLAPLLQPASASPQSGQPFKHAVSELQSEPKQAPTALQHAPTRPLKAPQIEPVQFMTPVQQEFTQLPNVLKITPQQCPTQPKDTFSKPAVMTPPAAAADFDHEAGALTMPLGTPAAPRRRPSLASTSPEPALTARTVTNSTHNAALATRAGCSDTQAGRDGASSSVLSDSSDWDSSSSSTRPAWTSSRLSLRLGMWAGCQE
mmetsp:Transcript_12701/g.33715  ORF Transcript_12701/g.33715 Transcript_12701/m.33715 type:complete len:207 (+) Transcript_12701:452-1072(+)